MRLAALLVLWAGCALAQISVAPPLLGVIQDACGDIREVRGAAGSFQVGPAVQRARAPAMAEKEQARLEDRMLILRGQDGHEKRVLLPGPAGTLRAMGKGWLAAIPFAIRLTGDRAEVYRLPMPVCGGLR